MYNMYLYLVHLKYVRWWTKASPLTSSTSSSERSHLIQIQTFTKKKKKLLSYFREHPSIHSYGTNKQLQRCCPYQLYGLRLTSLPDEYKYNMIQFAPRVVFVCIPGMCCVCVATTACRAALEIWYSTFYKIGDQYPCVQFTHKIYIYIERVLLL